MLEFCNCGKQQVDGLARLVEREQRRQEHQVLWKAHKQNEHAILV